MVEIPNRQNDFASILSSLINFVTFLSLPLVSHNGSGHFRFSWFCGEGFSWFFWFYSSCTPKRLNLASTASFHWVSKCIGSLISNIITLCNTTFHPGVFGHSALKDAKMSILLYYTGHGISIESLSKYAEDSISASPRIKDYKGFNTNEIWKSKPNSDDWWLHETGIFGFDALLQLLKEQLK